MSVEGSIHIHNNINNAIVVLKLESQHVITSSV
jgi:hypothetical protein